MKRLATVLFMTLAATACGTARPNASETLDGDVRAANLWAGNVTALSERYTPDPCNNGGAWQLNDGDYTYGGWARQRAGYTNICFEVWMPGVTDQENADYWRLLDVQAHYRYEGQGTWMTEYVDSIGRHGNNRRYVVDMRDHDPFRTSTRPSVPHRVVTTLTDSSGRLWGYGESVMELYFTVNGHVLRKPNGWNFYVKYTEGQFIIHD